MAIDKRDLPLSVLQALDRITEKPSDLFRIAEGEGIIVRFEDNHPNPSQFFEFVKFEKQQLSLVIKPKSANDPGMSHISVTVDKVDGYFKKWLQHLEGYKNAKLLDDPILRKYEEDAYSEFELLDEDADINSYNIETQLWLDEFIDNSLKKLELHEKKDPLKSEIYQEFKQLKETQTRMTKKKVIQHLSKIYALTRKHSLSLLKDIFIEVKKEFIKQLISGQINLPT